MLNSDVKDSDTGAVLLMKKVYMWNFSKLCTVLFYTFYWFSGGEEIQYLQQKFKLFPKFMKVRGHGRFILNVTDANAVNSS